MFRTSPAGFHDHPTVPPLFPIMKTLTFLPRAAALAAVLITTPLSAAIYQEAFDVPGAPPDEWVIGGNFLETEGTVAVETMGGVTGLLQRRGVWNGTAYVGNARGNSWLYYTGDFGDGEVTGGQLSDFRASVLFRMGSSNAPQNGLMVRSLLPTSANVVDGYFVSFSRSGSISIYKSTTRTEPGTQLATSTLTSALASGGDYRLEVEAIGSTLKGAVYGWDDDANDYSLLLGSVTYDSVAEAYGSGVIGLRTNHDGPGQYILWRDLTITTIPEPSAAAILLPVGLAFLLRRKLKR